MEIFITLAVVALFTWLGYGMAEKRNRNSTLWAVLSFFFGIFAIIVLAIMGQAKEEV
jgi:hypothetical protein